MSKVKLYALFKLDYGKPPRKKRKAAGPTSYMPDVDEGIPPDLYEIYRYMPRTAANYETAKRILRLKDQYPTGTVPELITLDWLIRAKHDYYYQPTLQGGRARRGGLVPDFLILKGGYGDAWLIQGDYYHSEKFQSKYGQTGRDPAAKMRLKGQVIEGVRVRNVVQIKESSLYRNADQALTMAMQGVDS